MSDTPVLTLKGVDRLFGPIQVLFGVDIDLRAGEVHALIGENGAGKSTTMNIMCGYLQASNGELFLDGAKYLVLRSGQWARGAVRRRSESW